MKKNNDKKNDLYESKWEVFLRNYHNVPGFNALVKLSVYAIIFIAFIAIVSIGSHNQKSGDENTTTTTTTMETKKKYKDILNEFRTKNAEIELTSTINETSSKITASVKDGVITGVIKTNEFMKEFKIMNDEVFEVLLDSEVKNDELLSGIEKDFLIPSKLVDLIINNNGTKRIKDDIVLYNYSIDYNSNKYDIIVSVKGENINSIELNSGSNKYVIQYK